jgi:hypothetical protein
LVDEQPDEAVYENSCSEEEIFCEPQNQHAREPLSEHEFQVPESQEERNCEEHTNDDKSDSEVDERSSVAAYSDNNETGDEAVFDYISQNEKITKNSDCTKNDSMFMVLMFYLRRGLMFEKITATQFALHSISFRSICIAFRSFCIIFRT